MKILFLESYFKPEKTSGAHFAEDLRRALAQVGHTMELYAPTPTRGVSDETRQEYKNHKKRETELDGSLRIHRFSLYREGRNSLGRAIRYGILELKLLWFGLWARGIDLIPIGSTPPINGLLTTFIKKVRKIPFVYTVQDLFPESLVSTGMTSKGSILWKIGNWVSGVTYRNAAHIIVISEGMKKTLVEKGVPEDKITVIYNWIDTETTRPIPRQENPLFEEFQLSRDFFYVTYAGNLGNSQNVSLLVDCAEKLADRQDVRFVIFGDGSEREMLAARIAKSALTNIQLLPMQPVEKVSQVYSLGDVSFVICKKGVGLGAFPSKAASIMATGTPVIASFDEDSDLCRVLQKGQAGVCVPPEDAQAAMEAILQLYTDRKTCAQMGENARKLACTKFFRETGVSAKIAVFEKFSKRAMTDIKKAR